MSSILLKMKESGFAKVGFRQLVSIPDKTNQDFRHRIAILIAKNPAIMRQILHIEFARSTGLEKFPRFAITAVVVAINAFVGAAVV